MRNRQIKGPQNEDFSKSLNEGVTKLSCNKVQCS